VQMTATSILNTALVTENRFQYSRARQNAIEDNQAPAIVVLDSFIGGGPQIGESSSKGQRWEVRNTNSIGFHQHSLKVGARVRGVRIENLSSANFGGTFTFSGGTAPKLDANDNVVHDPSGQPIPISISSIERYRRTLTFQERGLPPAAIRELGGGASLLSLASGDPLAKVKQFDVGAFIQDDWRLRPSLTLSFGLRYEVQTNLRGIGSLAPRLAFAWSPSFSASKPSSTVIRGGFGIFY